MIDRGGDDQKLFRYLLDNEQQFVIRLDRRGGQRCLTVGLPEDQECHRVSVLTAHMGKIGYRKVHLPTEQEVLTLVHYHHGKHEPLALLTTCSLQTLKQAKKIAESYLHRWKIEDYLRFIKQQLQIEKIMLQYPERVDGMLVAIQLASAFVMSEMEQLDRGIVRWCFNRWAKREQCILNWSSLTRFLRTLFACWTLTFRTALNPLNAWQLALFAP